MKLRRMMLLLVLSGAGLCALFVGIYAAHVRASAKALIDSAMAIGSTEDAKREIAIWQKRSRESSWEQASPLSGDRSFDTRVENGLVHYLHISPPTAVGLTITMRAGELRSVLLVMFTGTDPRTTSGVWVQEWFDSNSEHEIHVNTKDKPWKATVEFSSAVPEIERRRAFALNADCFIKPRGCKSAADILPSVWQLGKDQELSERVARSGP